MKYNLQIQQLCLATLGYRTWPCPPHDGVFFFYSTAALPITITSVSPENPVVRLGTPLVLRCSAPSVRPLSFSWTVGSRTLTSSAGRYSIISTTSFSILNFTSVMEGDLGTVVCSVSDRLHAPLSSSLEVTETSRLYLFGDRTMETLHVEEGQQLVLMCPVRASSGASEVWFSGSRQLENNTAGTLLFQLENGTFVAELDRMVSVNRDDGDKYLCRVTKGGVRLEYNITVYVTSKHGCVCVCTCVCARVYVCVYLCHQ